MSARREYRCSDCGMLLFMANGVMANVDVEVPCRNRRCKRFNLVWLGAEQVITDDMRDRWRQRRARAEAAAIAS
jgi:phage FluMu protein Com